MGELLEKLASLAEEIFRYREDRNATIHEVATKLGKRERELTRQQCQRFDEQQISGFVKETPESEFKDITVRFAKVQEQHTGELRRATDQIVSWYKTLIQASSHVFEAENRMRSRSSGAEGLGA